MSLTVGLLFVLIVVVLFDGYYFTSLLGCCCFAFALSVWCDCVVVGCFDCLFSLFVSLCCLRLLNGVVSLVLAVFWFAILGCFLRLLVCLVAFGCLRRCLGCYLGCSDDLFVAFCLSFCLYVSFVLFLVGCWFVIAWC